ncbi:CDP-glucose 4,6-dehydratase [Dyella choica]|uniref:CDP-glucose 4,6-dehydratase n=1 Tax=Dyella choica TaxID=1927959 RepID=A0A432M8C8_9GAMM|nr:CDP-glucose 4,6-dehydratase [Dyella choica]
MEGVALNLFGGTYAGRRVLVTGHTGFKGSWLALWLRALNAEIAGLALDPDTHPSHWHILGLSDVADHRVDLRDAEGLARVFDTHRPEIIFHLAAQPLVRRSYRDPVGTFDTNVMGLVNLFEAARSCASVRVLINATTDKVYAEHANPDGYRETDPLGGHDPYSSSKACAELVSDSYRKSFFAAEGAGESPVRVATARAGNVIGGGDWAEDRLVPDLVRAAATGGALMIRNPAAVRPWQHVLEPLSGYLRLGQLLWNDAGFAGAWNFGPDAADEISVGSLVSQLSTHWPALRTEHDRAWHPHEAKLLRLNCDRARQQLAWRPVWNLSTALGRTASWYRGYYEAQRIDSERDLVAYVDDARYAGLEWTV